MRTAVKLCRTQLSTDKSAAAMAGKSRLGEPHEESHKVDRPPSMKFTALRARTTDGGAE